MMFSLAVAILFLSFAVQCSKKNKSKKSGISSPASLRQSSNSGASISQTRRSDKTATSVQNKSDQNSGTEGVEKKKTEEPISSKNLVPDRTQQTKSISMKKEEKKKQSGVALKKEALLMKTQATTTMSNEQIKAVPVMKTAKKSKEKSVSKNIPKKTEKKCSKEQSIVSKNVSVIPVPVAKKESATKGQSTAKEITRHTTSDSDTFKHVKSIRDVVAEDRRLAAEKKAKNN